MLLTFGGGGLLDHLRCIKFLQMTVIFPESPQTFTWVEAKINYSYAESRPLPNSRVPGNFQKSSTDPWGNFFDLIPEVARGDVPSWN